MKIVNWIDKVKSFVGLRCNENLEQIKKELLELDPGIVGNEGRFSFKFNSSKAIELKLHEDKDFILKAISIYPNVVAPNLNDKFRNDKEIILQAVRANPYALWFASDRLKNDKNVVTRAIMSIGTAFCNHNNDNCGVAFRFASQNLRDDKELAIMAVKFKGDNIRFTSKRLRDDKDVVMAAIKKRTNELNDPLNFASQRLRNNADMQKYQSLFRIDHDLVYALEKKLEKLDTVGTTALLP